MRRYLAVVLILSGAACVSTETKLGNNALSNLEEINGFGQNDRRVGDPDLLGGGARYSTGVLDKYEKPIPFRFHTFVAFPTKEVVMAPTDRGEFDDMYRCSRSLQTDAESRLSFRDLREPFDKLAFRHIEHSGAALTTTGDMLFSIRWTIVDIPVSLTKNAPTNFCLVNTKVDVGERVMTEHYVDYLDRNAYWMSYLDFPPQKADPLFERENMYFVSPEILREEMEIELLEYLDQVLPTLNGEIVDRCGQFTIDPVKRCTHIYTREILTQEEALRCAVDDEEKSNIIAEIERIEGRLEAMSSQRDTSSTSVYNISKQCP